MTYTEEMRKEVMWPVGSPSQSVDENLQHSGLAVNYLGVGDIQNPFRTQLGRTVRYSIWEPYEKETWLCKT